MDQKLSLVAAWQRYCCMLTLFPTSPPLSASLLLPSAPETLAAHTGSRSLTRVGPTSTEVQALDRASVARVLGHWTGKVELVQRHGAMKYVLWRQGYSC